VIREFHVKNLTAFSEAELSFSKGLNILVGENGTGKSHLMKALYALLSVSAEEGRRHEKIPPTKAFLQGALAQKLIGVFQPEALGRLARRCRGRARCELSLLFEDPSQNISCSFATNSKSEVLVEDLPSHWISGESVYIPARELLSIYPNFVSVYERHYLEFEEIWRDTCLLLGNAPRRTLSNEEKEVRSLLLGPLEKGMGGTVVLDANGRFYLKKPGSKLEMHLVAEGHRKLAMLAHLIASGILLEKNSCLFWDEPEANCNSRLVKVIARSMFGLCQQGVQIIAATHDLFLLRELQMLSLGSPDLGVRYFSFHPRDEGVQILQGDSMEDVGDIAALDEVVDQSDRYLGFLGEERP